MEHLCYVWLAFIMLCYLLVTCWERADLLVILALVCVFTCVFVIFPCGILGQMCYMIVSIPDLCHLSYFGPNQDLVNIKVFCHFYLFILKTLRAIYISKFGKL